METIIKQIPRVLLTCAIALSLSGTILVYAADGESPRDAEQRTHQAFLLAKKAQPLLDAGKYAEAKEVLQGASQFDPNSNSAALHTNFGLALQHLGDVDGAIEEYNRAIGFNQDSEPALFNLGVCDMNTDKFDQALAIFSRLIHEYPSSPRLSDAKTAVKMIHAQLGTADNDAGQQNIEGSGEQSISSNQSDSSCVAVAPTRTAQISKAAAKQIVKDDARADYLPSVTENGTFRWAKESMPIKVYIAPAVKVRGYKERYVQYMITSFEDWMKASEGRLSCEIVDNEKNADIVCSWTSKKSDFALNKFGEQGETHIEPGPSDQNGNRTIKSATIKICTVELLGLMTLKDKDMISVCRHEAGHALGLQGHSPHFADVMFPGKLSTTIFTPVPMTITCERHLTPRDGATICHLYEKYPKSRHYDVSTAPSSEQQAASRSSTKHKIF